MQLWAPSSIWPADTRSGRCCLLTGSGRPPPSGEEADEERWAQACDVVLRREVGDELRALWTSHAPTQRRIVSLIADGQTPLYGVDAQTRYGLSRGGTAAKAIRTLIDAGDVVEEPSAVSRHRLVDPLFAAWVRAL